MEEPPRRDQPPNSDQYGCPQCGHYSEVPLYRFLDNNVYSASGGGDDDKEDGGCMCSLWWLLEGIYTLSSLHYNIERGLNSVVCNHDSTRHLKHCGYYFSNVGGCYNNTLQESMMGLIKSS